MNKLHTRLTQLEKIHTPQAQKYLCIYYDRPEENPEGYKIQPFMSKAGGTGGAAFTLPTLQDVDSFGARADVDLTRIVIQYASDMHTQPQSTYTQGDYSFTVGVDMGEI